MPVPLYLSGVVIIFAFLDLGKNISFSDSLLAWINRNLGIVKVGKG
jgi:hypothetical protein